MVSFLGIGSLSTLLASENDDERKCVVYLDFNEPVTYSSFFEKRHRFYDPQVIQQLVREFYFSKRLLSRKMDLLGTGAKVTYVFDSRQSKEEFFRRTIELQPQLHDLIQSSSSKHFSLSST
jgi:hypothetical protein